MKTEAIHEKAQCENFQYGGVCKGSEVTEKSIPGSFLESLTEVVPCEASQMMFTGSTSRYKSKEGRECGVCEEQCPVECGWSLL